MHVTSVGHPYFVKRVVVSGSPFTAEPTQVGMEAGGLGTVTGTGTDLSRRRAAMGAWGELTERYTCAVRSVHIKGYAVSAFNLTRGRPEAVPLHRVLYADRRSVFPEGCDHPYISDSLGVACHRYSGAALQSAWFEFMERQSLIYNWLTASPGRAIEPSNLVEKQLSRVRAYFSEVKMFDISLHADLCVALVVGTGDKFMGVGCSADWNASEAVNGAIRELLSHVVIYLPPHAAGGRGTPTRWEVRGRTGNVYADYFYHEMTPGALWHAYSYLGQGTSHPIGRRSEGGIAKRMVTVASDLLFEPLVVHVPRHDGSAAEVVRVLGTGAYPHMRCDLLVPEQYAIHFHKGNVSVPNRGRLIPFS